MQWPWPVSMILVVPLKSFPLHVYIYIGPEQYAVVNVLENMPVWQNNLLIRCGIIIEHEMTVILFPTKFRKHSIMPSMIKIYQAVYIVHLSY